MARRYLGAVLEAPALVAGLDDFAVVGQPVEERGGHLGVAEDARPLAEGQVGGDDDGSALYPLEPVSVTLPPLGSDRPAELFSCVS